MFPSVIIINGSMNTGKITGLQPLSLKIDIRNSKKLELLKCSNIALEGSI